jgi:hypothetical protein
MRKLWLTNADPTMTASSDVMLARWAPLICQSGFERARSQIPVVLLGPSGRR